MSVVTGIAIYLTIWWTALFAILPLGGKTYWSEGQEPPVKGMDSGAPIEPRLKQKFLLTTAVTTVLFVLLWLTIHFHWVTLPEFPNTYRVP
jgi:predicted secreted protein